MASLEKGLVNFIGDYIAQQSTTHSFTSEADKHTFINALLKHKSTQVIILESLAKLTPIINKQVFKQRRGNVFLAEGQ